MNFGDFLLSPVATVRDVISCIDSNRKGIAAIVDEERRLIGLLTDGDIRRAILAGTSLDQKAMDLLAAKANPLYPEPVTAPFETDSVALLQLMKERSLRQIPLLDGEGCVVDLVTLEDLLPQHVLPIRAVIMAGGRGTRLLPLTEGLPKPMLTIGDRPLMQHIIERMRSSGIHKVNVTTHYLPEKITDYFGNGEAFGMEINYVSEELPLGTAGALRLMDAADDPLLVINGDVLTDIDFRAMLSYHREHRAVVTVAVRQYRLQVPYGVVECDGVDVTSLKEKPSGSYLINAGIYLLEPSVSQQIPDDRPYDMTELIDRVLTDGERVVSFPIVEYWLDIGHLQDYEQAQEDVKNGKLAV